MSRGSLAIVCALAGVAAAEAPAQPTTPAPSNPGLIERSRLEVQPGGRAIHQLSIENPLGDVKIEGYDGTSIQIESRKQAPDEEALDRLRISLVPNPDGTVRITTTADGGKEFKTLGRSQVRIDLLIRAPRDARITAALSAGSLEVNNMDAGGDLGTSSGPISVRNVSGGVSTHSVSGATSITQVFGSVDAQTISANLDLDTIGGERLIASANRGQIAGRRVRARDVELTTVTGKIFLEAETSLRGRLVVSSLRGDVDVKLRRQGAISIRARGSKVNLGSAAANAKTQQDGWIYSQLGQVNGTSAPALIELRSRYGLVQFAIIE
ncbi:MAG: hypothetical protein JWP01_2863 [Myxococcales bacterium]|nr:hypothetical protein [Myxococcales bacterium]